MILLALFFVFVPFISVPGLIFSSYTQPLPLLLGWIYLGFVFKLSVRKKLVSLGIVFLFYTLFLGFLFQGSSMTGASLSVFIAYCIGFSSFFFLLSLFGSAFQRLRERDFSLAQRILESVRIILLLVACSSFLQLVPAFNAFLLYLKPRHVDLEDASLNASFRGVSGLLPEPSYVGLVCAVLLLVMFWFSFRLFIENYELTFSRSATPFVFVSPDNGSRGSTFYRIYASHLVFFFSSAQNLLALALSVLAIVLAFSPSSVLAFGLVLSSLLIPLALQFLRLRVSRRMLILIALVVGFFVFAVVASYVFFPGSRLSSIIDSVGDKGLTFLISGSDASSADRAASSISGLFSIFYHPFGLGVNGHGLIFSDCSEPIVADFRLMCGSIYNSGRNHNSLATVLQDGGIVSILLALLAFGFSVGRVFLRNFGSFSWVGRLTLLYLLFLFVILPSPLGAPTVWIALALILSFFSVSVRFGSPDRCPNV